MLTSMFLVLKYFKKSAMNHATLAFAAINLLMTEQ